MTISHVILSRDRLMFHRNGQPVVIKAGDPMALNLHPDRPDNALIYAWLQWRESKITDLEVWENARAIMKGEKP